MRISDWSSDVCSSDLFRRDCVGFDRLHFHGLRCWQTLHMALHILPFRQRGERPSGVAGGGKTQPFGHPALHLPAVIAAGQMIADDGLLRLDLLRDIGRSEEHTSELQSLMRTSYD